MRIAAVVPVRNKADVLDRCLASIRVASRAYPESRVVLVDNGSTDGSLEIQRAYATDFTLLTSTATRVGAVRNDGAKDIHDVDAFVFVDCDCEVPPEFFADVARTFQESGAAAVGCEVLSPSDGHWSEVVWDRLHRPGGDGPRHYINSACFAITSEWFRRIRGFDPDKISSEDVDICRRLTAAGGTMWQSERLAVIHLGNPKTIAGLYRRIRWHGEGVWEPGKGMQWSVTSIATLLHPVVFLLGMVSGLLLIANGARMGWIAIVFGVIGVPLGFVMARAIQHRRRVPLLGGIALMLITFQARLNGLARAFAAASRQTPQATSP